MDKLLEKWYNIKQDISRLAKEEEDIKIKIKTGMKAKKLTAFRTTNYRVKLTNMTRESLSKKDCPKDIWSKYCKTSSYSMIKLESLGEEVKDDA